MDSQKRKRKKKGRTHLSTPRKQGRKGRHPVAGDADILDQQAVVLEANNDECGSEPESGSISDGACPGEDTPFLGGAKPQVFSGESEPPKTITPANQENSQKQQGSEQQQQEQPNPSLPPVIIYPPPIMLSPPPGPVHPGPGSSAQPASLNIDPQILSSWPPPKQQTAAAAHKLCALAEAANARSQCEATKGAGLSTRTESLCNLVTTCLPLKPATSAERALGTVLLPLECVAASPFIFKLYKELNMSKGGQKRAPT